MWMGTPKNVKTKKSNMNLTLSKDPQEISSLKEEKTLGGNGFWYTSTFKMLKLYAQQNTQAAKATT